MKIIIFLEIDIPELMMQRDNKNNCVRMVWRSIIYMKCLYIQKNSSNKTGYSCADILQSVNTHMTSVLFKF